MAGTKQQRRRNFRAARLRRKLRLRQAFLDQGAGNVITSQQCDLLDTGHAAAHSAGHPSPEAQGESTPETGAVFSDDMRPKDDEGHNYEFSADEGSAERESKRGACAD